LVKFIHAIEGLSQWVGRAFGWCILILTLSVSYEVFVRYVLNAPTVWAFDMMVQMYGALFLMAGPYALEIASDSWRYKEVSWNSPARIQIYFFKTLIPVAGLLLMFQGVAEMLRCWMAMRSGTWLERLEDVRETEDRLMHLDDDDAEPDLGNR